MRQKKALICKYRSCLFLKLDMRLVLVDVDVKTVVGDEGLAVAGTEDLEGLCCRHLRPDQRLHDGEVL